MKLKTIALVYPGYLSRGAIQPNEKGSHFLVQGRDTSPGVLDYNKTDSLFTRFNPKLSKRDIELQDEDILFMSRGSKNYALLLRNVPSSTLAAASFFVIRIRTDKIIPEYVLWYLNHPSAQEYFTKNSGQGVHMPVVRKSILELINIPAPPTKTQERIAKLYQLALMEKKLSVELTTKRAQLIEAICIQAAKGDKHD